MLKSMTGLSSLAYAMGAIAQADDTKGPFQPIPEPGALELLIIGGVVATAIALAGRRK
jgi:hypothetical protein